MFDSIHDSTHHSVRLIGDTIEAKYTAILHSELLQSFAPHSLDFGLRHTRRMLRHFPPFLGTGQ